MQYIRRDSFSSTEANNERVWYRRGLSDFWPVDPQLLE